LPNPVYGGKTAVFTAQLLAGFVNTALAFGASVQQSIEGYKIWLRTVATGETGVV
jgi:hypothetical protein